MAGCHGPRYFGHRAGAGPAVRCAEAGWARKGAPNGRQWYPSISAAELNPQRRPRLGGGPGHEGSSWMRGVKLRVPALGAAVLTLLTAALTATVPAAGAAPAPAGRATTAASAWKIQPTPNPKIKQGRLNAVSCSSPRACTAVGVFDNVPGTGTLASVLFGVSCPAATFCVAVGNYQNRAGRHAILAEAWNGSSWSVMAALPPAGARRSFLNGVSCASATACTAVGSYQTRSGRHVTLAERWNGTAWSVQATPNPASPPRSALAAVSCTSSSACTAVGSSTSKTGTTRTLAERWNGTAWSLQPTPNGPFGGFLAGVSCPSPAACIAVGGDNNGLPLVEAWNGTSWSIPPTPATGGAQLNSVSCASPSACTAVGSGAFAERWDGTSWSIQPVPGIHDNAALTGVSCTTASACTAVGYDLEVTLGETWDGTAWSITPTITPLSLLGQHSLTAVSCTSPSACMAVGFTAQGVTGEATLAERWDGTRWTIVPTPNRPDSQLFGVSCTSPSACIAVGRSFPSGVLTMRWNGTAWSLLKTPNPAHPGDLFSVSCTSASACTAVGGSNNDRVTLAEVWNGTSWKIQPTPSTARADADVLFGVSCTSSSACTAVGEFARFGGRPVSLAQRWDGTSWSIQPTPNPLGSGNIVSLSGVSCTSGTACTAVGGFVNSSGQGGTLAEAWDGTSWSIQPTPALPPRDLPGLGGVSCTSASACIAVGSASDTLAEVWNGTAWSVDPTPPSPPSLAGIGGHLGGVWCTSAASCTAVGGYSNSGGNELTLAEARS